jgi:2,4-dienoyl-CoA reductase-like NADH-dependent reductase (Old Yellow Enzyme family)
VPEGLPLFVRFSATDYTEGGWNEEDCSQVARWCADAGADLFDISSGGLITGVQIPTGPGYQVPLANFVADRVDEPVSAVGQITDAHQAEAILAEGKIEVIMIGRAALRDPFWPLRAAAALGEEVDYWPNQYSRGKFPAA